MRAATTQSPRDGWCGWPYAEMPVPRVCSASCMSTAAAWPQDYVLAAEWYIRGAEQGDPAAQYLLGLMYDKGRGVPQDAVLAHKWLILAARANRAPRSRRLDQITRCGCDQDE